MTKRAHTLTILGLATATACAQEFLDRADEALSWSLFKDQVRARLSVKIGELHESVAHFKVRARDELGSATLHFSASYKDKSAKLAATMSVRCGSSSMRGASHARP